VVSAAAEKLAHAGDETEKARTMLDQAAQVAGCRKRPTLFDDTAIAALCPISQAEVDAAVQAAAERLVPPASWAWLLGVIRRGREQEAHQVAASPARAPPPRRKTRAEEDAEWERARAEIEAINARPAV
jgi:hypothetical protein